MVERRNDCLRTDQHIVADFDSALILELASGVDEHALADLRVLAAVRVEGREKTERLVNLARRQPRHERTHFLGRMIRAVQFGRNLQRLLLQGVKCLMKRTPCGNVRRLGHHTSKLFNLHPGFLFVSRKVR